MLTMINNSESHSENGNEHFVMVTMINNSESHSENGNDNCNDNTDNCNKWKSI